ncbi:hypothetical protein ACFYW6_23945 [Streptomyces sp. NPDC002659]|uniref:hypothetical protein n=1 Tax=Streptomyces sp. NPDC002659 TaxID=3364656 RepID=UPI0036AE66B8
MPTSFRSGSGGHPPGRLRRAARFGSISLASVFTGVGVELYADAHALAIGTALAVLPLLHLIIPVPARPEPDLQTEPAEPDQAERTPAVPESNSEPDLIGAAPDAHESHAQAPYEINLGTHPTRPVTVRMTLEHTVNFAPTVKPVINVDPQAPTVDDEKA